MTVAKEISKCNLKLIGIQEIRWDRGGTETADEYTIFNGKGNKNTKSTETLINANKDVCLEENPEKTKYILLSRHQKTGQNYDIQITNILRKCATVQMFGNDYNKWKPNSGGN
jgi:adenine-specific DNA methylase